MKSSLGTLSSASLMRFDLRYPCRISHLTFSSLSFLNASLLLVGSFGGGTIQPLIFNRPDTIWLHRKIAGDKEGDKLFLFNLSSLGKGYFLL
jgi:hypothetical protein